MHFPRLIDTHIAPRTRGKVDHGRGAALFDCPYDEAEDIVDWQDGWRLAQARAMKHALPNKAVDFTEIRATI